MASLLKLFRKSREKDTIWCGSTSSETGVGDGNDTEKVEEYEILSASVTEVLQMWGYGIEVEL